MSFLVPAMAFGAFAAAIPVLIHLFSRRRHQVVRWGAMHLLDAVVRVNRRRVRLEGVLLLLVRAGIPACVALFMARPVLTGWRALPGAAKGSVVVLLDNSFSMDAGGAGRCGFAAALAATDGVLAGLEGGSDAAVIPMAGGGRAAPTGDLRGLREEVRALRGGYGKADAARSIEEGLALLGTMRHAFRRLVVMTDFQRVSWGDREVRACAGAARASAVPPLITFLRVGSADTENVCVESLALSRAVVCVGQRVRVTATVKNHGSRAYPALRVRFRADGLDREAAQIALGPGERGQVVFSHTFETAGSHVLEVETDADPLVADNVLFAALVVREAIPVLLVTGGRGTGPLGDEIGYLELALGPFAAAGAERKDRFRARVIGPAALSAGELASAHVVVLAGVERLGADQAEALDEFVMSGGGLLLFPGSACDRTWYNETFANEPGGLLPVRLGAPAGSVEERAPTAIAGDRFRHPALVPFNDPESGSIAGVPVGRWLRLSVPAAGGGTVAARLETGDPFLVEGRRGDGRVFVCATSCGADWSALPLAPSYLPLMQQLVTYLAAAATPPRTVEAGTPLAALVPEGAQVTVSLPNGTKRSAPAATRGGRTFATFSGTDRPGIYTVDAAGMEPVRFAVNASRAESDLERLDQGEVAALAEAFGAEVVGSLSEFREIDARLRYGREAGNFFLWTAVVLLFAELFLVRRFARRRT